MKHLIIKNIGPLKEVDIALSKINLIIGPQSTGKSCILKIASFCAWLEKIICLFQLSEGFLSKITIKDRLIKFHNLDGYFRDESFFSYETEVMKYSFSFKDNSTTFEWKEGRHKYKRSKISYIVAERNILSVVPNWFELKLSDNSVRNFMTEWQNARNYNGDREKLPILNTDIDYKYDKERGIDRIILSNGNELSLLNASSGLQSLVPLFVFIDYIAKGFYDSHLMSVEDLNNNTAKYDHSDIYLEEPEENLFPETQIDLVNWLAEILNGERNHTLFIATHSPYIMSAFNNLIQAGDIIEESPEKKAEVEKIIGGNRAIKYNDVAAFAIANGSVHSIKDDELRLMSPSELDTVSDDISNIFNQLLEL
jgi:predicted ATP-dependent endonuclease of OLD family